MNYCVDSLDGLIKHARNGEIFDECKFELLSILRSCSEHAVCSLLQRGTHNASNVEPFAQEVVHHMGSYESISPSNKNTSEDVSVLTH